MLLVRRIDQPQRQVGLGHLLGHGAGGDDEHLVGHALRLGRVDRHAHGGEDVDVVALARHERLAVDTSPAGTGLPLAKIARPSDQR